MKDFVIYIIKKLVDNPKEVKVEESEMPDGPLLFRVNVAPSDFGKVIGKNGKIIKALRNLLKIIAIKEGKMVRLELVEPSHL